MDWGGAVQVGARLGPGHGRDGGNVGAQVRHQVVATVVPRLKQSLIGFRPHLDAPSPASDLPG